MTAAEVWFLRAEAALRNWTDEDAGICYEKGLLPLYINMVSCRQIRI